ncbi:MAG: YbhN family protein [Corynebacterium sp.]|nr:YbhN family protein [Corynebacterium sp.]
MKRWVSIIVPIGVLALAIFLFRDQLGFVRRGLSELAAASWWLIICGFACSLASLYAMSAVQRVLFTATGVRVSAGESFSLTMSANAWSTTFPGGAAFSTAYQYSQQRRWGATALAIGWYIIFSATLSTVWLIAIAMSTLALTGMSVANFSVGPLLLTGFFLLVVSLILYLVSVKHPKLAQIQLAPLPFVTAAGWSLANWLLDIAALWLCLSALDIHPSIVAVFAAYAVAKIVGTVQVTPGGLGPVEAAMIAALSTAGITSSTAVGAVFAYRLVSFVAITVTGWVLYGIRSFRTEPDPAATEPVGGGPELPPAQAS